MFRSREDTKVQEVRVKEEINLLQEDKERDELLVQTLHVNYLIILS